MLSSAVPFKCYYGNEIRRINLQAGDRPIAYSQLVEQLQAAFAIPPTQQLKLRWLDDEGDKVGLTTTEELTDAVRSLIARQQDGKPGQAVRIFVTPSDPAEVHEGVTCDGCGCGVTGSRFKCVLCPNFDLCSACVSTNAHSQHPMLLIRRSHDFPQFAGGYRRRRGCGPCGPRFCGFFERAAAAAAAAAAEAATEAAASATETTGASSEDAATARPPPPPPAATAAAEEPMATADATGCHGTETPEPRVARALEHMRAMGFSDDGGWLTRLLVAKEGDISAVLDAIRPVK